MRIQVKDFMSAPVKTAVPGNTVSEIRDIMNKYDIHCVPIVEYEKQLPDPNVTIKGIVTSSDVLNNKDGNVKASDLTELRKVHIINKNSSAHAAAEMMLRHEVHHLIVMDEGEIIGVISSLDFVKLVANHSIG